MTRGARAGAAIAACALALLGLAACGSDGGSGSELSYVADDGSTVILPASAREPAPQVRAPTLAKGAFTGPEFDLAAHKGEVVVLNVWASWCAPCRAEAPALARVSRDLAGQGVVFAGLNTRDSATAAQAFVDRFSVPYPSLDDTDGLLQLGFRDSLPVLRVPTTVVIDRQGRVAARALGEVDESRLRGMIEPLLRERA